MAPKKKVSALIKLQIQAGKANPAPPLGPALGSHGVNIMDFCKQYNAQTQDKMGQVIPVEITVYEDRSFTFILKTPPAAALLLKAAGIQKGTENPLTHKVGSVTKAQLREIAEIKMADLSARDVEAGMKIIAGTARSMAITIIHCEEKDTWLSVPRSTAKRLRRSIATTFTPPTRLSLCSSPCRPTTSTRPSKPCTV